MKAGDEEVKPKTGKIELRDMYSLVDRSLLKDTLSDQPHYIEVGEAQGFCRKYSKQNAEQVINRYEEVLFEMKGFMDRNVSEKVKKEL